MTKKIGILYICTGNYVVFWEDFYLSMEKNFIPESEKYYFVFTDSPEIAYEHDNKNIHRVFQKNLGWPDNTLLRFEILLNSVEQYRTMDYIFFFNANLLVKEPISARDFLPTDKEKLMACLSPGFYAKPSSKFPYEKNPLSRAYIPRGQGNYYFAGGLNGGITSDFIIAMQNMRTATEEDEKHGIMAIFHDESHWNKYLLNMPNIKIISASYLYPEGWILNIPEIIMIRDKQKYGGHYKLRGEKLSVGQYLYLTTRRTLGSFKRKIFSWLRIPN